MHKNNPILSVAIQDVETDKQTSVRIKLTGWQDRHTGLPDEAIKVL